LLLVTPSNSLTHQWPDSAPVSAKAVDDELILRSIVLCALQVGVIDTFGERSDRDQLDQLVARYGCISASAINAPWMSVFGMPHFYGIDTAYCVNCANTIAELLDPPQGGLVVGHAAWFAGPVQLPWRDRRSSLARRTKLCRGMPSSR